MKKIVLPILLIGAIIVGVVAYSDNGSVKDKRIIGTWQGYNYVTGTYEYVFKENGRVQLYTEDYVRDFTAENGVLRISQGKYGEDYHEYKFTVGVTENGETVEYLIIDEEQRLRRLS